MMRNVPKNLTTNEKSPQPCRRHYYDIDQTAATEYVYAYRDMWELKGMQRGHN